MGFFKNFIKIVKQEAYYAGLTKPEWEKSDKKIVQYTERQIVSRFMDQIDDVLGKEYLEYACIYNLRQETLQQLKNAYQESPKDLIDFSNSIDHRLWALKQMAHLTFEEIGTGRHHLQDYLKPEGQILAKVNRMCLQKAFNLHYIDKAEYEDALKDLENLIREVGTWA